MSIIHKHQKPVLNLQVNTQSAKDVIFICCKTFGYCFLILLINKFRLFEICINNKVWLSRLLSQNNSMRHFLGIIYFPILSTFIYPFLVPLHICFTFLQTREHSSFCPLLPKLIKETATWMLDSSFPVKTQVHYPDGDPWWLLAFNWTPMGNHLFRPLLQWTFLRLTVSAIWNITVNTNDTWIKYSDCKHYRKQVIFPS